MAWFLVKLQTKNLSHQSSDSARVYRLWSCRDRVVNSSERVGCSIPAPGSLSSQIERVASSAAERLRSDVVAHYVSTGVNAAASRNGGQVAQHVRARSEKFDSDIVPEETHALGPYCEPKKRSWQFKTLESNERRRATRRTPAATNAHTTC